MTVQYKVSYSFAQSSDASLAAFASSVIDHMTGNESFSTPVIPMPSLVGSRNAFVDAMDAASQGGKMLTAAKNAARAFLISCLRQEAAYVQSLAGEDLAMLLSSGFTSASKNREQVVLATPLIISVLPYQSGALKVKAAMPPTGRGFELRCKNGTGDYQTVGVFPSSRKMIAPNLVPGSIYTMQLRAIGGITGYSDWSSPVSQMAM